MLAATGQHSLALGLADLELTGALLDLETEVAALVLGADQLDDLNRALSVADEGRGVGQAHRGHVLVIYLVDQH